MVARTYAWRTPAEWIVLVFLQVTITLLLGDLVGLMNLDWRMSLAWGGIAALASLVVSFVSYLFRLGDSKPLVE